MPDLEKNICNSAMTYYYDYIEGDLAEIPANMLAHISSCDLCQENISHLREELTDECDNNDFAIQNQLLTDLRKHFTFLDKAVDCPTINLFIPSLIYGTIKPDLQTPINLHIANCQHCTEKQNRIETIDLTSDQLKKINLLVNNHKISTKTIMIQAGIPADDAKIVNNILTDKSNKTVTRLSSRNKNNNEVELISELISKEHPSQPNTFRIALRQMLLKPVATAAIIAIALVLFSIRPVNAIDIENIYNTVCKIPYLHLKDYSADNRLIQEKWISEPTGEFLLITPSSTCLLDLDKNNIKEMDTALAGSQVNTRKVLSQKIPESPWGLFPFRSLSEAPIGAKWEEIPQSNETNSKSYCLEWAETNNRGEKISKKWVVTYDTQTEKPQKIDWLRKYHDSKDYEIISTTYIDYVNHEDVIKQINQTGLNAAARDI